ncbi:hypothetical protein BAE44_0001822 [Dichanthelium oligosanthes]|uniref:Uncharacterized protein n=1 Tax=Dichanthelium oligosanthes TaxID=888268 RepID=A0A1E5WIC8_9POAL|nr:hypothetical protein BAE44_0001822 [Dichanthelium oligosanthes]
MKVGTGPFTPSIALTNRFDVVDELDMTLFVQQGDYPCKASRCPCRRLENRKTDRIVLLSLEEVETKGDGEADHKVELVRMLRRCSATFKKKVSISVPGGIETEYTRREIRSIVRPNDKFKITVRA